MNCDERRHGAGRQRGVENVWEFLRANFLSHRVWRGYDAVVDACCHARLLVAGFSLRDLPAALENATSSWLP